MFCVNVVVNLYLCKMPETLYKPSFALWQKNTESQP